MQWRLGSLFSGYGGLDLGVTTALARRGITVTPAWHAEIDAHPARILAHHYPHVPNLGDVTKVDFTQIEQVDVITGGFPCQDVSLAGARRGLQAGTRSGLWSEMARAVSEQRPRLVVIENVRGLLSARAGEVFDDWLRTMGHAPSSLVAAGRDDRPVLRALGAVLGDLADLGYDARWCGLRAADVGAPHGRYRIFITARPAADTGGAAVGELA